MLATRVVNDLLTVVDHALRRGVRCSDHAGVEDDQVFCWVPQLPSRYLSVACRSWRRTHVKCRWSDSAIYVTHGDKKACVKFGMMLQQNADRHAEWRHSHPDWFFFEH